MFSHKAFYDVGVRACRFCRQSVSPMLHDFYQLLIEAVSSVVFLYPERNLAFGMSCYPRLSIAIGYPDWTVTMRDWNGWHDIQIEIGSSGYLNRTTLSHNFGIL